MIDSTLTFSAENWTLLVAAISQTVTLFTSFLQTCNFKNSCVTLFMKHFNLIPEITPRCSRCNKHANRQSLVYFWTGFPLAMPNNESQSLVRILCVFFFFWPVGGMLREEKFGLDSPTVRELREYAIVWDNSRFTKKVVVHSFKFCGNPLHKEIHLLIVVVQ